ncbi:uncharacterized protein EDB93DRAFT_474797 [Suillus bovinus]|uniref:uncharacterized protein n=1 Tax=Suillus bovinus TaxID=48563 RepID=UPI001B85C645|nr:uncharacterized protein EDB93DRAFT_474797 [Suillus bovinus]KAG2146421.1 hypothetical protein EDB93DRAFT_474797 [Suillus bovinus]
MGLLQSAHPYMWFTVTTKANFAPVVADPLTKTATALRQSMNDGKFTDTKYYAMSRRRTRGSSEETRFVYANSAILDHDTAVMSSSFAKGNSLFVQYNHEYGLMMDAKQYDYHLDSDISDSEEEEVKEKTSTSTSTKQKTKWRPKPKGKAQGAPSMSQSPRCRYSESYSLRAASPESDASTDTISDISDLTSDSGNSSLSDWAASHPGFRSTDTLRAEPMPPPYSPTQQIVLVRNTAFATWASYVYYRYTGQVSFYPLKSKDPLSRRNNGTETLRCSPKSMYRLAFKLKNERLKALAFQAIKSNLSKNNILDEAFSWFTAQYPDIQKMELEFLMEFRSAPEVSGRLKQFLESVSRGQRPYAHAMLHAFLVNLTLPGASGTK